MLRAVLLARAHGVSADPAREVPPTRPDRRTGEDGSAVAPGRGTSFDRTPDGYAVYRRDVDVDIAGSRMTHTPTVDGPTPPHTDGECS